MRKDQHLYIGIDLGTSRSTVSASNGESHLTDTYVGWPIDMVARKVLKKSILIGSEAVESRTMVDLHRPLEHGLIKEGSEQDLIAVREILRYLVELAVGDVTNEDEENKAEAPKKPKRPKIRAVVGVPAAALRTSRQFLRSAMDGIVDEVMIVSEPFAVAYGLDALAHTMIIDIGAGTADFCVMSGRLPTDEDQRSLNTAGDYIDSQLLNILNEHHPEASISLNMVRQWKESSSFVGKSRKTIKVTVPVEGKPVELDIAAEMKTACQSIVDPVIETMLDLLARAEPEFQSKIRNNIILTGGSGLIANLDDALEKALVEYGGGAVKVVEDPVYVGSEGGLALAVEAPAAEWKRLASLVPAQE